MEPHRMIEARHLHTVEIGATVGQECRVKQGHVARVGDDAGVEHRVVGKTSIGAHPHQLRGRALT